MGGRFSMDNSLRKYVVDSRLRLASGDMSFSTCTHADVTALLHLLAMLQVRWAGQALPCKIAAHDRKNALSLRLLSRSQGLLATLQ